MTKLEGLSKQQPINPANILANIFGSVGTKKSNASFQKNATKEISVGDKKLEEKVMKLMNNMQIISENIDVPMSKLNVHLEEVTLKHPNDKIQNKWVNKA